MKHNEMIRLFALLLAALFCLSCGALAETSETGEPEASGEDAPASYDIIYSASNPIPAIAAAVRPSVVQIICKLENWDPETREASVVDQSSGSGTYIRASEDGEGGYLLTNYHVVQDSDLFTALWLDGTEMDLTLVGYDDGCDIAVLYFEGPVPGDAQPVPMGDSDALQIGELAIAIGNPGSGDEVLYSTVTAGIISGLQRGNINAGNFQHAVSVIQTDAPINTGNSGGALLNSKGELVGIPTLKMGMTYTTVFEGLGFCIPISFVKDYIDQIIENGTVVRPRMGVTVTTLDGPEEPMRRYPPAGAQVYQVEPGTPAYRSGLEVNDVITEANGDRIYSAQDMVAAVDKCGEGDDMVLKVYRYNYDLEGNVTGGYEELTITVQLEIID